MFSLIKQNFFEQSTYIFTPLFSFMITVVLTIHFNQNILTIALKILNYVFLSSIIFYQVNDLEYNIDLAGII